VVATGNGETDRGQWRTPLERDFLTGCAVLLRREMLDDIGLFDEDTFSPAYYEDSDLCWRARAAGWRLIMAPAAHLWHRGVGSSGGAGSPRERYLMARNSVRFFRKHVRGWRWLIVLPYRLGSALRTTATLLGNGQWPSVRAYWRGLRDGLVARERLSQTTRE
jgi:GT2 family glycosyltransferase